MASSEPGAHCLPAELLRRCLEPLSHHELLRAGTVCREWQQAARCESLWRSRFAADFTRTAAMAGSRAGGSSLGCPAARLFQEEPAAPLPSAPTGSSWREAYQQRMELEHNWRSGRCSWVRLEGHRDYIRCAQLAPGGASLASCSGSFMHHDCSIRLWDVASGACTEHLEGHAGPIWSMQYDGRRVASCDDEGVVRLWDLQTHRVGVASALGDTPLKCLGMDEQQLVVGGESGTLALWSLDSIQAALQDSSPPAPDDYPAGEDQEEPEGEEGEPRLPAWRKVALEGEAAGVRPSVARAPHQSPALCPDITCLQVDGGLCATGEAGSTHGSVHLWSTAGCELQHRAQLPGHRKGVSTLSFQHSTGWLVAGSGQGLLWLWDLHSARAVCQLRGHSADILCHQQAGTLLASGSADRTVRLWDVRSGASEAAAAHVLPLGTFPYSLQMDDRRLAVGCANGMVQVVDLRCLGQSSSSPEEGSGSGGKALRPPAGKLRPLTVLPAHSERVWSVALSEGHLISASLDSSIIVRSFRPADQPASPGGQGCRPWQRSDTSGAELGGVPGSSGSSRSSDREDDDELDSAYASSAESGSDAEVEDASGSESEGEDAL